MSANVSLPLLDRVRIASPCPVRWEDMHGDNQTRRCDLCGLNVHNISAMTAAQAEAFLAPYTAPDADGNLPRLCGHIYRRADGTILTADCPVGLAALRAKAHRAAARIAAAIGLTALVAWAAAHEAPSLPFARVQPLGAIAAWLRGSPTPPPSAIYSYDGDISFAPPKATPGNGAPR